MKKLWLAGAATAAMMALTSSAFAADSGGVVFMPPPVAPLAPPPPPAFDWSGAYVGTFGGAILGDAWQAGIQGGYNFTTGMLLYGAEAQLGFAFGSGHALEADLNARAGIILGDRLVPYAEVGVGFLRNNLAYYDFGGGVELGVADHLSVFGEAKLLHGFGGAGNGVTVQGGIIWHPDY